MGALVLIAFLSLLLVVAIVMKKKNIFSLGSFQWVGYLTILGIIATTGWFGANFMAEPGLIYHARTIQGAEHAYSSAGWKYQGFGKVFDWKRAMSVVICVSEGCNIRATLIAPARYCDLHWRQWWNCEQCTELDNCPTHEKETN